jgi:hypothetical protein
MMEISFVAERLLDSQEGLGFLESDGKLLFIIKFIRQLQNTRS